MNQQEKDVSRLRELFTTIKKTIREDSFFPAIKDFVLFIQSVPVYKEQLDMAAYEFGKAETAYKQAEKELSEATIEKVKSVSGEADTKQSPIERIKSLNLAQLDFPKLKEKRTKTLARFKEAEKKFNYESFMKLLAISDYYLSGAENIPIGKIHLRVEAEEAIECISLEKRKWYLNHAEQIINHPRGKPRGITTSRSALCEALRIPALSPDS